MVKFKNWMKSLAEKFTSRDQEESPAPVETASSIAVPDPTPTPTPAPIEHTVRTPKPVRREIPDEPKSQSGQKVTFINSGEEIKVVERGAKTYAVCPKCESMWNILERTRHPRFRSQEGPKELTCPSCDQPVSLPATLDLRKL